ncbi:MAG: SRPBCC family protein [Streptomycetales bacterium]
MRNHHDPLAGRPRGPHDPHHRRLRPQRLCGLHRPERLRRWFAPHGCEVTEVDMDLRVGGRYRVVVTDPGGGVHTTTGEYRELVPGKRLVMSWIYEDPDPGAREETGLTVEFDETGPGVTELSLL